jgi:hypothetical protein
MSGRGLWRKFTFAHKATPRSPKLSGRERFVTCISKASNKVIVNLKFISDLHQQQQTMPSRPQSLGERGMPSCAINFYPTPIKYPAIPLNTGAAFA